MVSFPLSGNGDFDLDAGFDVDDDLLDNLGGRVEIDQTFVDAHFVHVPSLRSLTAGGFSGGDLEWIVSLSLMIKKGTHKCGEGGWICRELSSVRIWQDVIAGEFVERRHRWPGRWPLHAFKAILPLS